MTQFEMTEDGRGVVFVTTESKRIDMSKPDRPTDFKETFKSDEMLTGEEAVYSHGEYIKRKRNLYLTELPAYLGKTWWK